ncbi:MAG: trigger factor [Anaerolineae bacterium]
MNAQTEILENRIAQIKVEVEAEALEQAKRQAARKLSQRVNIPGFRKGKAPYNIITRYLGEGAILEEAIDILGPEVYRQALAESELEPYAPGQLDNIEPGENNALIMTFSVPLVPVVELGDYREVRAEFNAPEVTDEQVEEVVQMLRSNRAITETKEGPADDGDSVTLDIYGEIKQDDDDAEPEVLFDQKNWEFVLGESVREPMPGFSEAVKGIAAEETRTFELTFPEDDEDFEESLRGKTVSFTVTCHKVESRQLPELDDEFAKALGEEGVETLDGLRDAIREDLLKNATIRAEAEYADTVLDKIVEGAKVEFPEIMVEETIDDMIHSFEHDLSRQGLDLQTYLKFSQMTEEALRNDFRETARMRLKRALVLGKLVKAEDMELDSRHIDRAIRDRAIQLSNGNDDLRKLFEQYLGNAEGRRSIANEILTQHAFDRIVAIGKGENPPTGPVPFVEEEVAEEEAESAVEDEAETVDEAETEVPVGEMGEDEATTEEQEAEAIEAAEPADTDEA